MKPSWKRAYLGTWQVYSEDFMHKQGILTTWVGMMHADLGKSIPSDASTISLTI